MLPTSPQDPYRSDPTQTARQALDSAKSAHLRLDQLEIDKLQKRVKELEKTSRAQHGFFRTNWNAFWKFFSKLFEFEKIMFAFGGYVVLLLLFGLRTCSINTEENAKQTCQEMDAVYVTNSSLGGGYVTCARPDGTYIVMNETSITIIKPDQEPSLTQDN